MSKPCTNDRVPEDEPSGEGWAPESPRISPIPSERRLLDPHAARYVLDGFHDLLPVEDGLEPHLRGVLRDTLARPGGLFRAQIAYGILRSHGVTATSARALAIAIEYFHTASLLFDDMPAMDDAKERRGHTCPHRIHGEAATVLGALALITRAYDLLWNVIGPLPAVGRQSAARLVSDCLGVSGILNGQAQDLHFTGGAKAAREVAEGKTVSLVRLTLVLPGLVAGADDADIACLDRLATVWGLAYQILDDLKDQLFSGREAGKTTGRDRLLGRPNLADELGPAAACARLEGLLEEGRAIVESLAAEAQGWHVLERLQEVLDAERQAIESRTQAAA